MPAEPMRRWEGASTDALRERWGVPLLHVYARVGSTNDAARELAEAGAEAGTVVIAREQTAGRGRRGREWTAPAGSSLLLSMILRPGAPLAHSVLSLRLGVAAARAIERVAAVRVGVKWPNDLLIRGRKVAGILCEGAVEAGRSLHVVAGIGINLHQRDDDWPAPLAGTATSLAAATGKPLSPATLAEPLVEEWLAAARDDAGPLTPEEVQEFNRRDALAGRAVTVDGVNAGTAAGVTDDGALLVSHHGQLRRVRSGTVRASDQPEGAR